MSRDKIHFLPYMGKVKNSKIGAVFPQPDCKYYFH